MLERDSDPAQVVVCAAGARVQGRQHHQSWNADAKHHLCGSRA